MLKGGVGAAALESLLEALAKRPESDEEHALAAWLQTREGLIVQLQQVVVEKLADSDRLRLEQQVEALRHQDEALVAELRAKQEVLKNRLMESLRQRTALKGYRSDGTIHGRTASLKA